MAIEMKSVMEYGIEETAVLLNRGFTDYFVPVQFNMNSLLHLVAHDGLDLTSSRIMYQNGNAVGVGLIARRGWSSRLAAMAIVPEAQNQGVGKRFMQSLIDEAQQRGEKQMFLEVISANTAGIRLYEGAGFTTIRELHSYQLQSPTVETRFPDAEEVDIRDVATIVTAEGLPNLPWQVSGETVAGVTPPNRGYRLGDAYIVITNPGNKQVHIRSLIVKQSARKQGQATRLLQSLFAQFPGKSWHVAAIFPAEMDPFFKKLGFKNGQLSQLQMAADLR
jgi:ribosomal protein S18 acetylase RimI-like enzyme